MSKKQIHLFSILLFFFVLNACSLITKEKNLPDPSSFVYKPIRFSPPAPERAVLENGLILYLLEDHELPIIEISALIRTGSVYEPPELAGLASITGTVMRTGGTIKMSPEEIDEKLEMLGATVNVSISTEEGRASLFVLKKDLDAGLDIFSEILMHPAFDPEKLSLAKEKKCQALRRIKENPQSIAFREYKKLLYRGNPRANLPTITSVKKIERKDLVSFHNNFFHPNRTILAISGDFSRNDMVEKIKKCFFDWAPTDQKIPSIAPPEPVSNLETYHEQKEISQSTIIMGHLAPEKSHPNYFTFQVLNYILGGGGFSSRLMAEIRLSRGLAYSVGSFFRGDVDYGVFGAYCMTKATSTHQAISLIFDIINNLKDGIMSREELGWAKESLLNSFIFSYSSSLQIVAQQMALEYENLPPDFLRKTPEKIRAVTLEDLQRVAKRYLHPTRILLLTVGDADKFDRPISEWEWGPVNPVSSDIES
jgi:predicted Zn-dependent peptidase